jgi:hypothetical protein
MMPPKGIMKRGSKVWMLAQKEARTSEMNDKDKGSYNFLLLALTFSFLT